MSRLAAALALVSALASPALADDVPPRKVALLVGVEKYLKPGFAELQFCEDDVNAVAVELTKLGFQVTVLRGSAKDESERATKDNIEATTRQLVKPLGSNDVILIMLSGHGQTLHRDPKVVPSEETIDQFEGYFCPYDAVLNDAESQVSLNFLLDDILKQNVGRKLLVLDACRDVPVDRTPGARNARGIDASRIDLRKGTSVYLSCSFGQRSFEKPDVGHGVFTYCLLDGLRGGAVRDGELAWADLVAHVNRRMRSPEILKLMPPNQPQVPFPAGDLTDTLLGRVEVRPVATTPQPRPTSPPSPSGSGDGSEGIEGKQAGEVRSFTDLGVKFCWCPSGSFTMGSPESENERLYNEEQVPVTLSQGFWLGQSEVTQGLWQSVMGTTPWSGKEYVKEGVSYPAVYISHGLGSDETVEKDSATEFCRKLTVREHAAGRLPSAWAYELPTEAQWEYACRAGTTGAYNGDGTGILSDYAWYDKNARFVRAEYAHEVGQKKPNDWGLYDLHGNVWEWCRDGYGRELPGGRDPRPSSSDYSARVVRGGGWFTIASSCRSATRMKYGPFDRMFDLGFRLTLSASRE